MSSRYFSRALTYSFCWFTLCYSIRSCVGVVFSRDSMSDSYNDNGYSSEGNRIDTDFVNDSERGQMDDEPYNKGWNYVDNKKKWTPHEKTISLQFMDDDGRYTHAPPAWPHDEYLLQNPYSTNFNGLMHIKNGSEQSEPESQNQPSETDKEYEWTRLRPRPPTSSALIGPGFYDDRANSLSSTKFPTHQAITDGSSSSVAVSSSSSSAGTGGVPNSVSESANHGKFYNAHAQAYDQYRRKRLRMKIHPAVLAAPIAGFAAYKAVSAFVTKPLLFELGWVNNRPNIEIGGGGWGGGGWGGGGFNGGQYPPYYPPLVPVHINPYPPYPYVPPVVNYPRPAGDLVPQYPILRPNRNQDAQKSSWWNPFSALTPRFRGKKERKSCCKS